MSLGPGLVLPGGLALGGCFPQAAAGTPGSSVLVILRIKKVKMRRESESVQRKKI